MKPLLALVVAAGMAAAGLGLGALAMPAEAAPPEVTVVLDVYEKEVRIFGAPFGAWTFNGTVPGPVIRVAQGTVLHLTLRNLHTEPHSVHTHLQDYPMSSDGSSHTLPSSLVTHQSEDTFGALGATSGLGVQGPELGGNPLGAYIPRLDSDTVPPGGTYTYHLKADEVGAFVYHCHVFPVSEHIGRGLMGLILVYPPGWRWEELPEVQPGTGNVDAWVTSPDGTRWREDVVMLSDLDPTTLTEKASLPATAGHAKVHLVNFRAWNDPYYLGPVANNTPMRVVVANLGNELHSWHIHGHNFNVLEKFDPAQRVLTRTDVLLVAPGQSYVTTLVATHPGFWFVHDHTITQAYAGMIAWLNVQE